jgi:hypothetical protein
LLVVLDDVLDLDIPPFTFKVLCHKTAVAMGRFIFAAQKTGAFKGSVVKLVLNLPFFQ